MDNDKIVLEYVQWQTLLEYGQLQIFLEYGKWKKKFIGKWTMKIFWNKDNEKNFGIWTMTKFISNMDNGKICR